MRHRPRVLRVVLALVVALLVSGVGALRDTQIGAARAAPLAQAAPGPFVQQAFDLLMDRFVTPPSSQTLLSGGWEGGARFVQERASAAPAGGAPAFSGDRAQDWAAFLGAYPGLVTALAGAAEQVDLDRAVVSGMARILDSNDTFYLSPDRSALSSGQDQFVGIGVTFSEHLVVTEVFPGSPAQSSSVQVGDRLTAVDGTSVEGISLIETSPLVRGAAGSTVQITVARASSTEPVVLQITRAPVQVDWAASRMLEDSVGYLRIRSYPRSDAIGTFQSALATLEQGNARAVVIDVRGSLGGAFATFEQVASRFIAQGPLYQSTNRQGQQRVVNVDGSFWGRTVPIAIMVNQTSRSQNELLAEALRANGGAIVGVKTAGAVTGGMIFPLEDGSSLVVTTLDVKSGQGKVLNRVGVEPDIAVELDPALLAQGKDSQLEAALGHLRGKLGQ